jgi:hypothetical protein
MEILTELKPFIDGSISIFNTYLLFQLINIKAEMQREKEYFLKFREEERTNNDNLDRRLKKIEIQAARRWSTWQ